MEILKNVSLKPFNTFGINVQARSFADVHSFRDLQLLLASYRDQGEHILVMGGGSNILFTKDFEGLIVRISTKGIIKIHENEDYVLLNVQAGEVWDDFVNYCLEHHYGGIENLAMIPGTVGSCPIQNIGAYGVEVKDTIESVEVVNIQSLQMYELSNSECRFDYRDSIFKHELKGKVVISSVNFQLQKKHTVHAEYGSIRDELKALGVNDPNIKDIAVAVCNIRRCKLPDPKEIGNSGSFFKNPTFSKDVITELKSLFSGIPFYTIDEDSFKIPAGWLIEQCGWKGYRKGDAGVHANQALVLVNYGNAKGMEILELAWTIQNSIFEKFEINLKMEVNVV